MNGVARVDYCDDSVRISSKVNAPIYSSEDLVSIITPCHNSSRFISQAIESVLMQTYSNWEMIIIHDRSKDNSIDIIEHYIKRDNRIKLIKLDDSCSAAVARNLAIQHARGRYIAFLDSDDIWLPEKLEKQIIFMKNNSIVLSYSSYYLINNVGEDIGLFFTKEVATYDSLLKTCYIGNLTAIYDAAQIGKRYMEDVGHEDYTLWLNILKENNKVKGIIEPLAKYRLHNKSVSANKIRAVRWQWNIYRNIENLALFISIYYFMHYIYYGFIKYRK